MNLVELPQLVKGMREAVVIRWIKGIGESVNAGDPLWEIETEKAIVEMESPFTGVLRAVHCQPNDVIPVGFTAAQIGELNEPILDIRRGSDNLSSAPVESSPKENLEEVIIPFPKVSFQEESESLRATGTENGEVCTAGVMNGSVVGVRPMNTFLRSSGVRSEYQGGCNRVDFGETYHGIKRAALEQSMQPEDYSGAANPSVGYASPYSCSPAPLATVADMSGAVTGSGCFQCGYYPQSETGKSCDKTGIPDKWSQIDLETLPKEEKRTALSPLRRTISQRMTYSVQNIPTSVMFRKADVTDLVKMRLKVNRFSKCKISLNDYVTKAIIMALTQTRGINTAFIDNEIVEYSDINLGFAVDATEGLLVPVLHKSQNMTIIELAHKSKELIQKANDGKLTLKDFAHPTFSISNSGVFGVEYSVPIIVAPQSGIMGVGTVVDEPVLKDGTWESHKKLGLSYALDHRVIDGALGAKFLQNVINLLENPLELIWREE